MALTYKDSGVNKEAGYSQVKLIREMVRSTYSSAVLAELGGFGAMYELDTTASKQPILVSGTDGVGTKLDLAFRMNVHNTVGIDCVAMCVNDVLCQGAKPLFFLDYIATGKLIPEKMAEIVAGVVEGCKQSGMALIGGETAEMPGIYQENHYDLAGFAVGLVERDHVLTPGKVCVGDKLIGLKSTGVHSNGFSLVRKILFELQKKELSEKIPVLGKSIGEALLTPTKIYVQDVLPLLSEFHIHAISHITGGGIIENLPRSLAEGQAAYWDLTAYEIPPIFRLLQEWGEIESREMFNTFNMGIGMVLIVAADEYQAILQNLASRDIAFVEMGEVIPEESLPLSEKTDGIWLRNLKGKTL